LLSLKFDSIEDPRRSANWSNVSSPDLFNDCANAMKSTTVALLSLSSFKSASDVLVDAEFSSSFSSWLCFSHFPSGVEE